jgi:fibronectin type 3 domain-containing protein
LSSATAGSNSVALSWSAPASDGGAAITGYNVYRSSFSGGETLLVSLGNVTSYSDLGVVNGQTYYYQVTAVNSVGESVRSGERSATPATLAATIPGAPTLDSATPGNRVVTLAWSAPAPNGSSAITGYRVYRRSASGSATLLTSLGNVTSYADTTVSNGVTYYYSVSAVNAGGEGAPSAERGALPAAVPSAPGGFSVTASASSGIVLVWKAGANGGSPVTGYRIYRGTVNGSLTLYTTVGVSTNYADTGVVRGTTYYYRVSAVNAIGEGSLTGQKSAKAR